MHHKRIVSATLFLILINVTTWGQNSSDNDSLRTKWAKAQLDAALSDSNLHNVINPSFVLLDSKEKAVNFAEQVLFDIYGKKNIEKEKPYDIENVDGYWIIAGSLPKSLSTDSVVSLSVGGVFLIIFNSHDGKIVRITHGK